MLNCFFEEIANSIALVVTFILDKIYRTIKAQNKEGEKSGHDPKKNTCL